MFPLLPAVCWMAVGSAHAQDASHGPSTLLAPKPPVPTATGHGLEAFRRITVSGDVAVHIHGDAHEATAEVDCPTRQGPGIQVHVQTDTLSVTPMHEGQRTTGHCTLTLRAAGIEAIQLAGASKLRAGAMSSLTEVHVGGATHLDLRGLTAPMFSLTIDGAGKARLSGRVESMTLTIAGAASIDASDQVAEVATLTTHGAGNIEATVNEKVHAHTSGPGAITVLGQPVEVVQNSSGLGRVVVK